MKTIIKLKNYGAYVSLRDEWKFYLHPLSIMIGFAFDFHSIFFSLFYLWALNTLFTFIFLYSLV